MIRLTLDLPTTAEELGAYADALRLVEHEGGVEGLGGLLLSATLTWAPAATPVQAEPPAPAKTPAAKAPRKDPATPRRAKAKGATPMPPGALTSAILNTIEAHDGTYEGSIADLAREAAPDNHQSAEKTIYRMADKGALVMHREGRWVRSITLPKATPAPTEPPARPTPPPAPLPPAAGRPLRPVPTPPAEGLQAPAGGWG